MVDIIWWIFNIYVYVCMLVVCQEKILRILHLAILHFANWLPNDEMKSFRFLENDILIEKNYTVSLGWKCCKLSSQLIRSFFSSYQLFMTNAEVWQFNSQYIICGTALLLYFNQAIHAFMPYVSCKMYMTSMIRTSFNCKTLWQAVMGAKWLITTVGSFNNWDEF